MKIDTVYVLCNRWDLEFARCCVTSIRYFCPEVPLVLFKDLTNGAFETNEIEKRFNTTSRIASIRGGHGFSKLELLFGNTPERRLILDADTLLTGDLVSRLEQCNADFVVSPEAFTNERDPKFANLYYEIDRIKTLDPGHQFPGFGFNTGHFVATTGRVTLDDFAPFLNWGSPPKPRYEETFSMADQGLLNYLLPKLARIGRLTLETAPFALWGFAPELGFTPEAVWAREAPAKVIHWAGKKPFDLTRMRHYAYLEGAVERYYANDPEGIQRHQQRIAVERLRRQRENRILQFKLRLKSFLDALRGKFQSS